MSTYVPFDIRMACMTMQHCMQHTSTVSTYPGSCKTCFFLIPVLGKKVSSIFPIIDLTVDLRSNLHTGLFDLVNPLIFANTYPGWHNYSLWGLLFQFHDHWVKTCSFLACINSVEITNYIKIRPIYCYHVHPCNSTYSWGSSQGVVTPWQTKLQPNMSIWT